MGKSWIFNREPHEPHERKNSKCLFHLSSFPDAPLRHSRLDRESSVFQSTLIHRDPRSCSSRCSRLILFSIHARAGQYNFHTKPQSHKGLNNHPIKKQTIKIYHLPQRTSAFAEAMAGQAEGTGNHINS